MNTMNYYNNTWTPLFGIFPCVPWEPGYGTSILACIDAYSWSLSCIIQLFLKDGYVRLQRLRSFSQITLNNNANTSTMASWVTVQCFGSRSPVSIVNMCSFDVGSASSVESCSGSDPKNVIPSSSGYTVMSVAYGSSLTTIQYGSFVDTLMWASRRSNASPENHVASYKMLLLSIDQCKYG